MTFVGIRKARFSTDIVEPEPEIPVPAVFAARSANSKRRRSNLLGTTVMALIVPGLFATVALPAYAFVPQETAEAARANEALHAISEANAQSLVVAEDVSGLDVKRDAFDATTEAELRRAALARQYANSGPGVAALLANPRYPNFSLARVAQVARQYQGVPYVYGGASPSGFDCSGLVMYVYAQFGVSLPHSVSGQAARGTRIARSAAVPGDMVVMSGHNGIYLGNGTFIDAPGPGRSVVIRQIWTDAYSIYRIGI